MNAKAINSASFPHIAVIVLAAGASNRLGVPKQLLKYNGITLLRRTVETVLLSKVKFVHVVLGFEAEKIKLEICKLASRYCRKSKLAEWHQHIYSFRHTITRAEH